MKKHIALSASLALTLLFGCDLFSIEEDCIQTIIRLENPVDERFSVNFVDDTDSDNNFYVIAEPNSTKKWEVPLSDFAFRNYAVVVLYYPAGDIYYNTDVVSITECEENEYTINPELATTVGCNEDYSGPNDPNAVQRDVFCQQAYILICSGLDKSSSEVQTACRLYDELNTSSGPTCPYCE